MDVFFETPSYPGRTFSIEIGFFDTVLEIKEKILKYHGIPVSHQTLHFNGQVLQDNRDVESCEILQFSCIKLLIEPKSLKIQLFFNVPMAKSMVSVTMGADETVARLKDKIYEMNGVPRCPIVLYSYGKELEEDRSLSECGLVQNSKVVVFIKAMDALATPFLGRKKFVI